MGSTLCTMFPSSASNDNSVGSIAWLNPSNAVSSNGNIASSATTGFTTCAMTAGSPTSNRLKVLFESIVCGEDAQGTWSIPSDATITGAEFHVEWNQVGTTGTVTELEAKLLKAGSIVGDEQGSSLAIYNSSSGVSYQARYFVYGGQVALFGTTIAYADLGAASGFGIALRLTGDGVNAVDAVLDSVVCRIHYTVPDLTASIRSNSAEATRQAPWFYRAHCCASRFKTYSPEQCFIRWEMIEFPNGWNPGSHTDPANGETVLLTKRHGFNVSWPCDTAGTYKVRCTIYAPDMSESSSAEESFAVEADSRTHRYYDPDATGANNGTSAADAWTAASSVVTDANANPSDRWYHLADGKNFNTAALITLTSLSNVVIGADSSSNRATVSRTTQTAVAMWAFGTAATRVVLMNLTFTGTTGPGFNFGGAVTNCGTIDCGSTGIQSFNQNESTASMRRGITHWKPTCTGLVNYGMFIDGTGTDIDMCAPEFINSGTNTSEGMIRIVASVSSVKDAARANIEYGNFPGVVGATSAQGMIRLWTPWSSVYHCYTAQCANSHIGQNADAAIQYPAHTLRVDTLVGKHLSTWSGAVLSIGALGGTTDVCVVNTAIDPNSATTGGWQIGAVQPAGTKRVRVLHHSASPFTQSGGGDCMVLSTETSARTNSALEVSIYNGLFPLYNSADTYNGGRFVSNRVANDAFAGVGGNVYGLEDGGATTRTNWRNNNTSYNLTDWNALGFVADEIQVRLPRTAIDFDNQYSLANKSASGTVATGTSTTVFTGDSGLSSEDHYYCGWAIVVGANASKTVQSYVGSTRTFTLTSALSGTPASPDAIALSRDFATERANGKIAYAAGAQADFFGRFRDFGETNVVPGPNGLITLPTMSTVTVASVGDETAVLAWSAVTAATLYRVWCNYGSISDPAWYLVGETTGLTLPVSGITNDAEAILGVSVVDDVFNESSIYQIAATPTRGDTVARIYGTTAINTILGGGSAVDWVNPGNVNGAASGDYANASVNNQTTEALTCGVPATAISGTVIAMKLGFSLRTAAAPGAGSSIGTVMVRDSGGTAIALGFADQTISSATLTEYELDLVMDTGTWADLKAAIAAGITAADDGGVPVGMSIRGGATGATDFRVEAMWLQPILQGTATGGGFSSNQNVAATSLLLPARF